MKILMPILLFAMVTALLVKAYAVVINVPSSQIYQVPSPANEAFYFCTYSPRYHCYYRDLNVDEYNYPYYPTSNPYYNRYDYPPVIQNSEHPERYIEYVTPGGY